MSFFKDFRGEIKMLVVIFVVAIVVSTGAILILKSLSTLPQVQLESQQESVEAQPTEEPTEDTSNWQTYRNEEFGFEMKYPSDWEAIDDVRDTLVGYIRKQRIESKGPAVVIYRNFYSIEASTISELKNGLDERNLNDIQLREMDEESFLSGYKSSIDSIGGFDVVLTEGTVDHAGGDIVPLLNLHVLLDSGDILFFVGRLQEPYQSMFQSIRNISMMNASNWQTYRNEEFGFEIKYPRTWEFSERENGVAFKDSEKEYGFEGSPVSSLISISVENIPQGFIELEEYAQSEYRPNYKDTITNFAIDGVAAIKLSDYLRVETLIFHRGKLYNIYMTNLGYPEVYNAYTGLVSTFQFSE